MAQNHIVTILKVILNKYETLFIFERKLKLKEVNYLFFI